MLLDILFIYSKLNQDIGYRQGMHELLAPILWVVERDAIKRDDSDRAVDTDEELMGRVLDSRYVEHDSFTIFCALMQTAKAFYEVGDQGQPHTSNVNSSIMIRSRRIHNELLGILDPQLAIHLQAAEILPQIFVM